MMGLGILFSFGEFMVPCVISRGITGFWDPWLTRPQRLNICLTRSPLHENGIYVKYLFVYHPIISLLS